ncbi:MAG: hypothetical protein M0R73_02620 [Dehalococcoidia bacterium]|nr:hypothetical protein [Dehalococcoidia bacterium]
MALSEAGGIIQVETFNLPSQAISSGGTGNSLYDATPGDRTWAAAPAAGAPDTYSPPFTLSSFAILVQTAAVSVRVSSDGGGNYGPWVVLQPGTHSFELDATDIQIEQHTAGAEYQIAAFA